MGAEGFLRPAGMGRWRQSTCYQRIPERTHAAKTCPDRRTLEDDGCVARNDPAGPGKDHGRPKAAVVIRDPLAARRQ
jgi:hypothetical protein